VAVLYADWKTAGAPSPHQILRAAQAAGCTALLIDTQSKDGGSLTDFLAPPQLVKILGTARELGLQTVLAGSLTLQLACELLPLATDFVAVRGAVCRGGRTGRVDATLVTAFAKMLLSSPRTTIHRRKAKEPSPT